MGDFTFECFHDILVGVMETVPIKLRQQSTDLYDYRFDKSYDTPGFVENTVPAETKFFFRFGINDEVHAPSSEIRVTTLKFGCVVYLNDESQTATPMHSFLKNKHTKLNEMFVELNRRKRVTDIQS